jgi:hypothetical protein
MDPDQTARMLNFRRMRSLIRIHGGRKPIMLICRDAAHLFVETQTTPSKR